MQMSPSPPATRPQWTVNVDSMTREAWQQYCGNFSDDNLYQSWDYGAVTQSGRLRSVSRIVLLRSGAPVAACQFRLKRLPAVRIGVAEGNWGPLWDNADQPDAEVIARFLQALRDEYCIKRRLLLRLEPRVYVQTAASILEKELATSGFLRNRLARPYRTMVLDLTAGAEALRAGLHAKWRNCLSQSERACLQIDAGTTVAHFHRFRAIYDEMKRVKRFASGVPIERVAEYQRLAPEGSKLHVYVATDRGTDVAAGVFSRSGDSMLYYLGAALPLARKGSNPGYLLQWRAIDDAIRAGIRLYDLGGLTDLKDSGVDLFKVRMGGSRVVFPGVFEKSSSPATATYNFLERTFRRIRSSLVTA